VNHELSVAHSRTVSHGDVKKSEVQSVQTCQKTLQLEDREPEKAVHPHQVVDTLPVVHSAKIVP
jgi:hypothetical protein